MTREPAGTSPLRNAWPSENGRLVPATVDFSWNEVKPGPVGIGTAVIEPPVADDARKASARGAASPAAPPQPVTAIDAAPADSIVMKRRRVSMSSDGAAEPSLLISEVEK